MENEEGGGGIMSQRVFGLPMPLAIAGVGLIVYFIFFRNSGGSQATPSTSGGGGTITTGNTQIQKGAVTIDVKGGAVSGDTDSDKGKRKKHHHHHHHHHPPKRKITHHAAGG